MDSFSLSSAGFPPRLFLQLPGVIRVAGEEEDLVVFREGSDGLDGGGVENAEAHEKGNLE